MLFSLTATPSPRPLVQYYSHQSSLLNEIRTHQNEKVLLQMRGSATTTLEMTFGPEMLIKRWHASHGQPKNNATVAFGPLLRPLKT
ncbi:hypothetical protein CDL15_Pgr024601 [Punica granatum]|uniref:Uncharacterized protein n=1 Tax=Punica granatum TaxID=22663 RepID=A0A218XZZ0_PUNGR|nr:hypothetical protein CDL15_Pgr024601 [Punica granatum]